MEKISLWCKIIALISVLISIILLVLPESKNKKAFTTLLSLVMIYAFISPIATAEPDFKLPDDLFDTNTNTKTDEEYEYYEYYPILKAAESEIENYFNNLLATLNVSGECKASCKMEDGSVALEEITVYAEADDSKKEIIKAEIMKTYGEEILISFSGDGDGK